MPKTRRLFNKRNSTKFVLFTESRNEDGEKVKQNCLVPVSYNHVPGNSLLISKLAGECGPGTVIPPRDDEEKPQTSKNKEHCESSENCDLEKILDQFQDSDEEWLTDETATDSDDNEENETAINKFNMNLFQDSSGSNRGQFNMHIEVLKDGDEFFDEFGEGQFSDTESSDDGANELLGKLLKKCSIASSAKADCPENIKRLNEGFEKVISEYRDDKIGALDDEEIGGTFSTENEHVQNFINTPLEREEQLIEIGQCDDDLKNKILQYTEVDEPEKIVKIVTEKPLEWDCESILSTYSNKYNHPYVIREEPTKIRIPKNPLQKGLTKSKLRELDAVSEEASESEDDDKFSVATSCNIRPKGETPEQKRERKSLFKEAKRESRKLKKENKLAFKTEMKSQKIQEMNNRKNRCIKLL